MNYNPNIHHRKSIRLKGYDYSQAGAYFITICCQDKICRFGKIENGEMILNDYGQIAYDEWAKLPQRFNNFELDVFQIMPNHIHGIVVLNNMDSIVGAGLAPAPNNTPAPFDADTTPNKIAPAQNNPDSVRAGLAPAQSWQSQSAQSQSGQPQGLPLRMPQQNVVTTVGNIIGAYKSLVANACLNIYKSKCVGTITRAGASPAPTTVRPMMGKLWQRNYYEHIIRDEQSYHTISNYIMNNPLNWNEDKFYSL